MKQERIIVNILLIEDDAGLVALISEILEELGFSVTSVRSGAETFALLEKHTPDLMLLDYSLPDINGKELIESLNEQQTPPPPFIITTGQGDERIAVDMMKLGAIDYLVKDVLFLEKLPDVVKRAIKEIESDGKLRQTEEALRESEECFRKISENAPVLINSFDKDGRCLFWNKQCNKTFGWTLEEINEQESAMALFYPDPTVCEAVIRSITADPDGRFREWNPVTKYGKVLSMMWANFSLPNGQVFSMGHDITERELTEESLRESEENLSIILNSIGDAVIATDREGKITQMNPVAETLTGWLLEDAKSRLLSEVFKTTNAVSGEAIASPVEKVISSGAIVELEKQTILTSRDGIKRRIADSGAPIKNLAGEIVGVVLVFRDETERYGLEEKIRQSEKMQAVGQLAGGIAHDFNNQLTGILGYSEMLISSLKDEQLIKKANIIKKSALRAADLTTKLLDFSRKGKVLSVPVSIHKIIEEVAGILEHSINKQITIRQILNADPETTLGDHNQLQNALLNIAINARDAMPDGGELVFETAVVNLDKNFFQKQPYDTLPGSYLMISIADNGVGMDVETQNHMFEPFYTTKGIGKGTGMGLASVYGAIHNHKGYIGVYSEVDHGTTFRIYLPLINETLPPEQAEYNKPVEGTARILLVDDEEMILEYMTSALKELGYLVTTCSNGKEAVRYYENSWREVDLVILDMIMPVMGGRETFTLMKNINPEILAILSSGYSIDGEAQSILDDGVKAFITKPHRLIELSKKVAQVLQGK